jgi:hypothetical protein
MRSCSPACQVGALPAAKFIEEELEVGENMAEFLTVVAVDARGVPVPPARRILVIPVRRIPVKNPVTFIYSNKRCFKSAQGGTQHCFAHGGGRRCQEEGCTSQLTV